MARENKKIDDRFRDLRQYPRLALKQMARYCVVGDGKVKYGKMENIGGGGVCLHTDGPLTSGALLSIEFKLPPGNVSIIATARVAWCRQDVSENDLYAHRVGIYFDRIPPQSKESIIAFVTRHIDAEELEEGKKRVDGQMPSVLIVDSDKDTHDALDLMLSEKYRVVSAYDGHEALEVVHKECPDIILMEVSLPYIDGLQVLMMLKSSENTAKIPVIMVSHTTDRNQIMLASSEGAAGFMVKPLVPEVISQKLQQHIEVIEMV